MLRLRDGGRSHDRHANSRRVRALRRVRNIRPVTATAAERHFKVMDIEPCVRQLLSGGHNEVAVLFLLLLCEELSLFSVEGRSVSVDISSSTRPPQDVSRRYGTGTPVGVHFLGNQTSRS